MNILVIDGSFKFNTDGSDRNNNGRLSVMLKDAAGAAEAEGEFLGEQVATNFVHLHEVMPEVGFYNGNYEYMSTALITTLELMLDADAIIVGSQVAWYSMGSPLKSFIEHLTVLEYGEEELRQYFPNHELKDCRQLSSKIFGVIVTCNEDGGQQVANSIAAPLSDMGMHLPKGCMMYQNGSIPNDVSEDNWQRTYQRLVGENIVRMFCMMNGKKIDHNNWELRDEVTVDVDLES